MGGYVVAIAYSLYDWDTKYGTGGNLGWDYYQSMAFGGLYYEDSNGNIVETDSFIELVPSQQDRLNIRNILIAEQDGENSALGTDCE